MEEVPQQTHRNSLQDLFDDVSSVSFTVVTSLHDPGNQKGWKYHMTKTGSNENSRSMFHVDVKQCDGSGGWCHILSDGASSRRWVAVPVEQFSSSHQFQNQSNVCVRLKNLLQLDLTVEITVRHNSRTQQSQVTTWHWWSSWSRWCSVCKVSQCYQSLLPIINMTHHSSSATNHTHNQLLIKWHEGTETHSRYSGVTDAAGRRFQCEQSSYRSATKETERSIVWDINMLHAVSLHSKSTGFKQPGLEKHIVAGKR